MESRIQKTIDYFYRYFSITHDLSIEERGRRRLFTIFLILLAMPLFLFGIYLTKTGQYKYGIADIILSIIFIIFIFLLSVVKNARPMYRIVLILLCLLLLYWINKGAIKGCASIWILTFPPYSFYLMGKREGFAWTILLALISIMHFFIPELSLTDFVYEKDYAVRHLFSFFLITFFTYSYESTREKYQRTTESDQNKLKEHQIKLEETVNERTLHLQQKMNELEESEQRYRLFADNITDMIWSVDINFNFTFISPSVTRMYGYTVEEAMTVPHNKWNTPESYTLLMNEIEKQLKINRQNLNPDQTVILQLDHFKKDGTVFPVELKASFILDNKHNLTGFTGITRDISDKIRIENEKEKIREQLVQAQKMEAVGTLAGGLAHDFNNFLGGIIGSFELISKFLEKENIKNMDMIGKYLQIGLDSSRRSADLIKQLLALSRKHEIHLTPVNIQKSLEHVYELFKNSLPKSIEIEFTTCEDPLFIMGEPAQMEQVLLNLCINASHAMTIMRPVNEKQGGTLTIKAERIKPDKIISSYYTGLTDTESWARISIIDTGVGMDAETRNRIFEPFYSRKEKSSGTGLGLAISYNIVQKHGGILYVDSRPGKGTNFTLYLPVFNDNLINLTDNAEGLLHKGSGTILVIDDEIFMLNIARGFLEQCGYQVITAEGANEGIETYKKYHSNIAAVLIDYSMPGKNGIEVFVDLKKINGSIKAILSSGMLDGITRNIAIEAGISDTVNKPYTIAELSDRMKKIVVC
ncbi:MAG TPA: PAS domain S-box protein [Spirochaetota bacterium]|nr:PAS domain S-box protein [Spirochaetota bacterium]